MTKLKAVSSKTAGKQRSWRTPLSSLSPPASGGKRLGRPALDMYFSRLPEHAFTLLVAPQGYGKTFLLSSWHARLVESGATPIWITLEHGINGPARLACVLHDACASLIAAEHTEPSDISEEDARRHVQHLGHLLHNCEVRPVLFIDQLEALNDPDTQDLLADFLFHLPPAANVVVASTMTPQWVTPKLQLTRETQVLERDVLAFSALELEAFMQLEGHDSLSEEDVLRLSDATGGWPAAIRLASLALKKAQTPREHAEIVQGEFPLLFEYLDRNIISELDPHLREFLHKTAHLKRLRVDLCNHVCSAENADNCLSELLNLGLLEGNKYSDSWFSFQPLLHNFLTQQLHKEGRNKLVERHRRASDWYRDFGMPDAGLYHALQADDYDRAITICATNARELVVAGGAALIEQFAKSLPEDKIDKHPYILWPYVWMLVISQRFTEADTYLRTLKQRQEAGVVDESAVPFMPTSEDLEVIEYRIKAALDQEWSEPAVWLKLKSKLGNRTDFLQEQIELSLGSAYFRRSKFSDAYTAFQEARHLAEVNHTPITTVSATTRMAEIRYMQGQLPEAMYLCLEAIDLASLVPGQFSSLTGIPRLLASRILFDQNQLAESEKHYYEAQAMFQMYRATHYLIDSALHRARLANASSGWQSALHILDEAIAKLPENVHESNINQLRAEQVKYELLGGHLEQAKVLLTRLGAPLASRGPNPTFHCKRSEENTYLSYCRFLVQTGEYTTASAWLTKLLNQAKSTEKLSLAVEIAAQLVAAHDGGDNEHRTLRTVRETLQLAEQTGVIRPLIEAGDTLRPLVKKLRKSQPQEGPDAGNSQFNAVTELLLNPGADSEPQLAGKRTASGPRAQDGVADTSSLTPRELELITLISAGLSNKMIASELIIGEGTVKWHLKNIYLKLGVGSRTQAASKARSMGLLE